MSLPSISIRRAVTTPPFLPEKRRDTKSVERWRTALMLFAGVLLIGVIAFRNLAGGFSPSVRIPNDHDAALE
jgi:hypothetical protein